MEKSCHSFITKQRKITFSQQIGSESYLSPLRGSLRVSAPPLPGAQFTDSDFRIAAFSSVFEFNYPGLFTIRAACRAPGPGGILDRRGSLVERAELWKHLHHQQQQLPAAAVTELDGFMSLLGGPERRLPVPSRKIPLSNQSRVRHETPCSCWLSYYWLGWSGVLVCAARSFSSSVVIISLFSPHAQLCQTTEIQEEEEKEEGGPRVHVHADS